MGKDQRDRPAFDLKAGGPHPERFHYSFSN
jgi:hypothetical protein